MATDFDVVIIGSGFGGSVAALRLTEKGYKVAVLEAGRRFTERDFPKTSWRLSRFLYLPRLGLKGIQRIHALPNVLVLAGAGVGGVVERQHPAPQAKKIAPGAPGRSDTGGEISIVVTESRLDESGRPYVVKEMPLPHVRGEMNRTNHLGRGAKMFSGR